MPCFVHLLSDQLHVDFSGTSVLKLVRLLFIFPSTMIWGGWSHQLHLSHGCNNYDCFTVSTFTTMEVFGAPFCTNKTWSVIQLDVSFAHVPVTFWLDAQVVFVHYSLEARKVLLNLCGIHALMLDGSNAWFILLLQNLFTVTFPDKMDDFSWLISVSHLVALMLYTVSQKKLCHCFMSHASWKVLGFFLKILGPGKSWKSTLVLESPGKISLKIMH